VISSFNSNVNAKLKKVFLRVDRVKKLFNILTTILVLIALALPGYADNSVVIKDVVIDEAGRLIMIETKPDQNLPRPAVSRLVDPNRLVIDIPNAILGTKPRIIKVNNNDVKQVKVSQFDSKPENIVRIVVETEKEKVIDKLKVSASQGTSFIQLDNLPNGSISATLEDNSQIKITKIDYRDNQLTIGAIGTIRIKEPFILKDPTRLVIDIPNAAVSDKQLLTPIIVNDDMVDVVRVGQFDENTVRLVIETEHPNRLYPLYGADQQSLYISSNPTFSVENLPKGVSLGYIKDIKVTQDEGLGTIVRIETTTPLAHRVKRIHEPDKVVIDLINAEPPSEDLTSRLPSTPELQGIKVGQLMAGNPNSRIVIDLASPGIDIRTNVSIDGKIMEIVLRKGESPLMFAAGDGTIKVVLDAGHGGYDPGCQADGYKEKDIVLDITKRVKLLLEKANVRVFMTRSDDSTVSLKERVEFTNNVKPAAFVSIHVNASTRSAPEGIDTHWYTNQSIPLAKSIQNSLINNVSAVDRGIKKNMFYVIHHTPVPAALVEVGFLTNPRERREILTHSRKQKTAKGIAEGVLKFLGTKYPVSEKELQR
jgi:N-acetylmuramoyl-L-alanine amidase